MEQINEENYEICKALESKYESHAAKFQQIDEQWQRTTTEVNYIEEQASKLAGCINAKLAEQLGQQADDQRELIKDYNDHQSAIRKRIDAHKMSITADIVRMSQWTTKVLQQNARLENQRDQKSSSSSGCCMGFLRCCRTTPAKAPAMAVVPNSFWDSTAAPMLPSQLFAEQQQFIADLERKLTQLKAATSTGGSSGSGGPGNP